MTTPRAKPAAPHRWSMVVGTPFGIEVRIHATFAILLVWIFLNHLSHGQPLSAALAGMLLTLAVFGTIVLHELGHALTARRFGIRTLHITLWPIGGIAQLDRFPDKPAQELAVALAGPAVNVGLAGIFGALVVATGGSLSPDALTMVGGALLPKLMWINLGLAAFNLIPAFPMDGGRALRALLGFWLPKERATDGAAAAGKTLAVVFAIAGLMFAPTLLLIAAFVWFGATAEANEAHLRKRLEGVKAAELMITRFEVVDAAATLGAAAGFTANSFQTEFPVVREGRVVGMVGRRAVMAALGELGPFAPVTAAMRRGFPVAAPDEPVVDVLRRLFEPEASGVVAVVSDGRAVGLISERTLVELVEVPAAVPAPPRMVAAAR